MVQLPEDVLAVMRDLEARNERDAVEETPQAERLRAITPEVGRFLLTLVIATGARRIVEVGTSGGYSTLWLALGADRTVGRVVTFEIDPAKVARARAAFDRVAVADRIDLREDDGCAGVEELRDVDLVFLDAEKADYERILEPAIAALRHGGLLVADNLISHEADLAAFRDRALADPRLNGLVVPVGKGELVAVRV